MQKYNVVRNNDHNFKILGEIYSTNIYAYPKPAVESVVSNKV